MVQITLPAAIRRLVALGMPDPAEFSVGGGQFIAMRFGRSWIDLEEGSSSLVVARNHFTLLALDWYLRLDRPALELGLQSSADLAGLLDAVVNAAEEEAEEPT